MFSGGGLSNILLRSFSRLGDKRFSSSLVSVTSANIPQAKILTLNRPPVNGLTLEMIADIVDNINQLSSDNHVQGVIVKSSSPKVFCAGLDLSCVVNADSSGIRDIGRNLHDLWLSLYSSRLTVLSAINGPVIAGGCLITSASDYRVMVGTGSVGVTESLLGIKPPWYMRETVVRLLGARMAEQAFITGRVFKAQDSLKIGFVDEVVDSSSDLDVRCKEVMKQWLAVPVFGRGGAKLELRRDVIDYAANNRQAIEDSFVECMISDSVQKSITDYFESRKKPKK